MTTLTTFMLECPFAAKSVQLIGSWDNFSKPYPMSKDSGRGKLHWRGCHSFENIVCDGEEHHMAPGKRDGGLKMGGKYWYYYQLDDEIEYHDPTEPSTDACPLLPGQCVNVLDVPVEKMDSRDATAGRSASLEFTMNPADKYITPRPVPSPTSPTSPEHLPSPRPSESMGRLRRKKSSIEDCATVTGTSHSMTASLRSAFSFSNLKTAQKDYNSSKGRSSRPRTRPRGTPAADWDISEPVLVSRTDENRSCISLEEASANMANRDLRRPLPSPTVAEVTDSSPLRGYLKDRSWDNSPILPAASSPVQDSFGCPLERCALKPLLPEEINDNGLRITSQIFAAAEAEDDDFNFNSEDDALQLLPSPSHGLSPPPSRARLEPAAPIITSIPPISISHASRPPSRAPPPPPIRTQSYFSSSSASIAASSAPSSPCFSSLASDDSVTHSPPPHLSSHYFNDATAASVTPSLLSDNSSFFSMTSFRSRSSALRNCTVSPPPISPTTLAPPSPSPPLPAVPSGHVLYHAITTDAIVTTTPTTATPSSLPPSPKVSFSTPRPRFAGYSLPAEDGSSQMTLTLRKNTPPTTTAVATPRVSSSGDGFAVAATESTVRNTFGSAPAPWKERFEEMQTLSSELGYLGEMIE